MRIVFTLLVIIWISVMASAQDSQPATRDNATEANATRRIGWEQSYDLAERIQGLSSWTSDGRPRDGDWNAILSLAWTLQGLHDADVQAVLVVFMINSQRDNPGDWQAWSKPMLLLRVMFDIPDEPQPAQQVSDVLYRDSGATICAGIPYRGCGATDRTPLATFSLPLTWNGNGPSLAACPYPAFSWTGPSYQPQQEFAYFRKHFKYRPGLKELLDKRQPTDRN